MGLGGGRPLCSRDLYSLFRCLLLLPSSIVLVYNQHGHLSRTAPARIEQLKKKVLVCGSLEWAIRNGRIFPGEEDQGRHVRREDRKQRGESVEIGVGRVSLWRGKRPVCSRNLWGVIERTPGEAGERAWL